MFHVRLAGNHLYGKWLFTWLTLVMSLGMSYFVLSFFPRGVLDEIWDWIDCSKFLGIFPANPPSVLLKKWWFYFKKKMHASQGLKSAHMRKKYIKFTWILIAKNSLLSKNQLVAIQTLIISTIQSTLVISTSVISNNRLSQRNNLVLV